MKKNLVVIGYGGMGGWHGNHAQNSDVVSLLGIYDIKEERSALAREKGIYAYGSLDEVLQDERVDIVTIATPNDVHREITEKALAHGKHVVCEKPVTLTTTDLQAMIDASVKANRIFTVHQNRRWDVDYLAIKQLYESGELGEVFNIESRIHGSRGIPGDWRGKKQYGGGMLFDWGVHLIDQILQIVKEPIVGITCRFDHITNDEVDDGFRLELEFEGGCRAFIEVATNNFISMPRFYMLGRAGSAIITDWQLNCKVVKCTQWKEQNVVPVQTAAGLTKTMAPRDALTVKEYELERPVSDVHDFYRNLCAAIDGTEPQRITHPEIMRVLRVIEAGFESAEKKQTLTTRI